MSVNRGHMWSICGLYPRIKSRESGQALPMTLAVLAVGALVIGPFLSQASTSLIGSRNYNTVIKDTYAADAGVEHCVWSLIDTGLAGTLTLGVPYTYPLPNQVNSITPSITVTKTQEAGGVIGEITDTIIDSFEFDPSNTLNPKIIHISGTVYAIAYTGPGNDGWLQTVNIAVNGNINQTALSTYEFDASNGVTPDIIHISGTVYAIAYTGQGSDGWLVTVNIADNGTITQSDISTYEFDTSNCIDPEIIPISGNIYAIAYTGSGNDGFLKTVTIAANGTITQSTISTYEFDASNGVNPDIIHISGNVYAIAYQGTSSDGFLITVTIAVNGTITQATIDTLEFDPANGFEPYIIHISGDVYAIVYRGTGNDGYMVTVTIATNGQIGNTVIDTLIFDSNQGYEPGIINITGNVYAIAYRDAATSGIAKTYEILTSGQITDTMIDILEFDSSTGYEPSIINIADNVYAIAYRGPQNDGFLKTIGIAQTAGSGTAVFSVQSIASGTTITASVSVTSGAASITSWVVQRH
ncbi:MAG: hypothetical protein PHY28_07755 [Dehalococcoidales bacterium]|nr:hypothetical protein [Dehalococcoidales bacterium]